MLNNDRDRPSALLATVSYTETNMEDATLPALIPETSVVTFDHVTKTKSHFLLFRFLPMKIKTHFYF